MATDDDEKALILFEEYFNDLSKWELDFIDGIIEKLDGGDDLNDQERYKLNEIWRERRG